MYPATAWRMIETLGIEWSFKYIYSDTVIRYITIQNRKQKRDSSSSTALVNPEEPLPLVVHTSITFVDDLMNEQGIDKATNGIFIYIYIYIYFCDVVCVIICGRVTIYGTHCC